MRRHAVRIMNAREVHQVLLAASLRRAKPGGDGGGKDLTAPDTPALREMARGIVAGYHADHPGQPLPELSRGMPRGLAPALCILAMATGFFSHQLMPQGTVSILAPPILALVAWNLVVYAWQAAVAVAKHGRTPPPPHWLSQLAALISRVLHGNRGLHHDFTRQWLRVAAPMLAAQSRATLHAAAACAAIGVVAGMYLRGLVLDYRAGWESTFMDAGAVHAVVRTVLAPASLVTGISIPTLETIRALRNPADPAVSSAALWIHLYAATTALFILLPRSALALASAGRASRLQRHLRDAESLPGVRILPKPAGSAHKTAVIPYRMRVDAEKRSEWTARLERTLDRKLLADWHPAINYGDEESMKSESLCTDRIVLAAIGATPEMETAGRLLERLAENGTARVVLDPAAFTSRYRHDPDLLERRIKERMENWKQVAGATHSPVDLLSE